jgi:hypothetical protein
MKWVGHVVSMREVINAYEVLVGQPEGKRPLGKSRRKREHIKLDLRVIGWEGVGWIQLDQCRVLFSQLVRLFVSLLLFTQEFRDMRNSPLIEIYIL